MEVISSRIIASEIIEWINQRGGIVDEVIAREVVKLFGVN